MKNKFGKLLIALIVVALAIYITNLNDNKKEERLTKNHLLTTGIIEKVTVLKGTCYINYSFVCNAKKYTELQRINLENTSLTYLNSILPEKKMTVIYEQSNIKNNRMLLRISDYNQFNIQVDTANEIVKILTSLKI